MSARTQLAAHLKTTLPRKSFTVVEAETLSDAITKATVFVRFRGYQPASNAMGNLVASFVVTLAIPNTEIRAAENELDERLPEVLAALRTVDALVWTNASKVIVKETYPGFDIDLTIPVNVST